MEFKVENQQKRLNHVHWASTLAVVQSCNS